MHLMRGNRPAIHTQRRGIGEQVAAAIGQQDDILVDHRPDGEVQAVAQVFLGEQRVDRRIGEVFGGLPEHHSFGQAQHP